MLPQLKGAMLGTHLLETENWSGCNAHPLVLCWKGAHLTVDWQWGQGQNTYTDWWPTSSLERLNLSWRWEKNPLLFTLQNWAYVKNHTEKGKGYNFEDSNTIYYRTRRKISEACNLNEMKKMLLIRVLIQFNLFKMKDGTIDNYVNIAHKNN